MKRLHLNKKDYVINPVRDFQRFQEKMTTASVDSTLHPNFVEKQMQNVRLLLQW